MHTQPSRWIWLTPLAVSVLAGWLTLNGITPEAASVPSSMPSSAPPRPAAAAAITTSAYPAPRVDPSAPLDEPAPTF
jgi:hypothetical protein